MRNIVVPAPVSPDGFLLQSSTVADSVPFEFSDGTKESVPCSYIEFAERLVLPQYKNLPDEEVKEFHRRDGFEVGNADKIFESTSMEQLTRKAV
uniref:2-oxoadipate dioxygenase/decarboxylase n=1 Tax=Chenopodium quinoa TaxID=63459 RepID=A0A803MBH6_CHEQI